MRWRQKSWSIVLLVLSASLPLRAAGEDLAVEPPYTIGPAERIALTQFDNAVEEAAAPAVVGLFQELLDRNSDRLMLMEASQPLEGTFVTYWPLSTALPSHLLDVVSDAPELLEAYRQREDRLADAAIKRAATTGDIQLARATADRFLATSYGDDALVVLADLAARRGWYTASRQALLRLGTPWAVVGNDPSGVRLPIGYCWSFFADRSRPAELVASVRGNAPRLPRQPVGNDVSATAVARGLIANLRFQGRHAAAQFESDVAKELGMNGEQTATPPLLSRPEPDEASSERVTLAKPPALDYVWSMPLVAAPQRTDFAAPAELPVARGRDPAIGENAVYENKLILHTGTALLGFVLDSGKGWPVAATGRPFFETGYQRGEVVFDGRTPIAGWPCFAPTLRGDVLLARFGPEITGWLPREDMDRTSFSQQFAFDLRREGALLPGYPLDPPSPEDVVWEWEGSPAVDGDVAVASIVSRDATGLRNRLVAWRIATATLLWVSPPLAAAPLAAHEAHRTGCSTPLIDSGTIYHCAGLGNVAALDLADGRILWTTAYPRQELATSRYAYRRRAAFRNRTALLATQGAVVVAAADCDRVFAVESDSGRLRWSTAPGVAADAVHLTDAGAGRVIASGDAVSWIAVRSGHIDHVFPSLPTSVPGAALPSPRGVGYPDHDGDWFYWPTEDAILVFPLRPPSDSVAPVAIHQLAPTRTPSGHVQVFRDRLVLRSGSQLTVFRIRR